MKVRFRVLSCLPALTALGLCSAPIAAQTATATDGSTSIRQPIQGGAAPTVVDPKDYPQGMLFPYSLLDYALADNVDLEGNVRYHNLKGNQYLERFLQAVAHADLSQFPVFKEHVVDEKTGRRSDTIEDHSPELVFWINAYNAYALSSIAQAYPVKNIDEIKDFETAQTHVVAGKAYSLNELREKVKSFGDPRAQFALVSGTAGGFLPSPTAIRYVELDERLNSAVSVFVNDPRNVRLNRIQNLVTINAAFQDIDEQFKPKSSRRKWDGIRQALAGYTDGRANRSYFTTHDYRFEFVAPDNRINDKPTISR